MNLKRGERLFQTRRQLKERILYLEGTLENEQRKNRLSEESGLAKCKGVICKACDHAVWIESGFGADRIIECDMSTSCQNFSRRKG